jgi:hypothetical protein
MKEIRKITIELTKDEVKDALLAYILSRDKTELTRIDNIDHIIKRTEIPGPHFHDCDWREEFDGIKVFGS